VSCTHFPHYPVCVNALPCETYPDDLGHLAGLDGAVAVDVVHLERPLELLLRFASGRDVDGQQELLEVDAAAVVCVKRPEHVLTELLGVALREETRIDLEELGPSQLARRAVLLQRAQQYKKYRTSDNFRQTFAANGY